MDLGLSGRNALLTGASRGIGRACAEALASEGVTLTLVARNAETLAQTAEAIRQSTGASVTTCTADITTHQGRAAALAACPAPDILLNNAAGMPPGDFRDWSSETWHRALDLMMLAPIEMIRLTYDGMIARGFGRIVNIAARGVKNPQPELGLSNGARSGLVGFCGGIVQQGVAQNVTINTILPGLTDTDGQVDHIAGMAAATGRSAEAIRAERVAGNPAGRFATAQEVAALFAFLASAHAGLMTGQAILMDGGEVPGAR